MYQVKKQVQAVEVYKKGYTGKNVGVAILDTGVSNHPDITGQVAFFMDLVQYRRILYDDHGHGTHVAGIIAGKDIGIAQDARLFIFKVLDSDGAGETRTALRALDYILTNHKKQKIQIVNFSVGFLSKSLRYDHTQILDKIEQLWKEGVVVVVAAGNNGPKKESVTIPGIDPMIITVGTTDEFSGKGPTEECIMKPEILAPGRQVMSLSNGIKRYTRKSGTSMATPIVSGAVALALEKNPSLTPREIKLALFQSATELEGQKYSWGLLNVDKFIEIV